MGLCSFIRSRRLKEIEKVEVKPVIIEAPKEEPKKSGGK